MKGTMVEIIAGTLLAITVANLPVSATVLNTNGQDLTTGKQLTLLLAKNDTGEKNIFTPGDKKALCRLDLEIHNELLREKLRLIKHERHAEARKIGEMMNEGKRNIRKDCGPMRALQPHRVRY